MAAIQLPTRGGIARFGTRVFEATFAPSQLPDGCLCFDREALLGRRL